MLVFHIVSVFSTATKTGFSKQVHCFPDLNCTGLLFFPKASLSISGAWKWMGKSIPSSCLQYVLEEVILSSEWPFRVFWLLTRVTYRMEMGFAFWICLLIRLIIIATHSIIFPSGLERNMCIFTWLLNLCTIHPCSWKGSCIARSSNCFCGNRYEVKCQTDPYLW